MTLAELVSNTGWLPHTARAALTGLRKRGYAVVIDRADKARGSVYRIEPSQMGGDSARHTSPEATGEARPDRPGGGASRVEPLRPSRCPSARGGDLIAALRDARRWLDELLIEPAQTIESFAMREHKSERSIRMTVSLAFVSPVLPEAALEGRLPRGFSVKRLTDLPMLWSEQWRAVGLRSQFRFGPNSANPRPPRTGGGSTTPPRFDVCGYRPPMRPLTPVSRRREMSEPRS